MQKVEIYGKIAVSNKKGEKIMINVFDTIVFAEGEAAAAGEVPAGAGFMPIIWLVIMFAVFWFMIIGPQKKQEKKQKAMLAALQVGDKIVTVGGICGKITKLKDDYVYIETGLVGTPNEKSTIKLERNAIKVVETIHDDQA